jgi:hypothetical protein
MAKVNLRGFFARRKDLTVQTERTIETKTQALNKKGEPIIENGKPKYNVSKATVKENPVKDFIIRCNNAVPPQHKMLR